MQLTALHPSARFGMECPFVTKHGFGMKGAFHSIPTVNILIFHRGGPKWIRAVFALSEPVPV